MQLVVQRLAGPVVSVQPDTPVGVCARLMLQHGFRHLPVVDEDERPLGVIEDMAVFRHGALLGPSLELWLAFDPTSDRLRARDLMEPFGGRVALGSSFVVAMQRLAAGRGGALAVVDDERLVGLVTEHDAVVAARDVVDPTRTVGEFATTPARQVDWLTPAHLALDQMTSSGVRHLAVLRDGALHAVVSLRDLVAENVTQRRHLTVDDVRRAGEVHVTAPSARVREAAARMARSHVGCLPVLGDDGVVVGMLTRSDLLRAAVHALELDRKEPPA